MSTDRLMEILADMVLSVLSWEKEHGGQSLEAKNGNKTALTGMSTGVHWQSGGKPPLEIIMGGQKDGSIDKSNDWTPPADVRRPEGTQS